MRYQAYYADGWICSFFIFHSVCVCEKICKIEQLKVLRRALILKSDNVLELESNQKDKMGRKKEKKEIIDCVSEDYSWKLPKISLIIFCVCILTYY